MCYLVYMEVRARVGVRELRQNLSTYLRRVGGGETLEVTERGRAVAVLAPVSHEPLDFADLIASGLLTEPSDDLFDLIPPKGRVTEDVSRALGELREERL